MSHPIENSEEALGSASPIKAPWYESVGDYIKDGFSTAAAKNNNSGVGAVPTSGNVFDVLYGGVKATGEALKDQLAEKFLGTKVGEHVSATAEKNTIMGIVKNPLVWVGVVLLILLIRRR